MQESRFESVSFIAYVLTFKLKIYPNNTRDVYLYIYWVSAYMG